VLITLVFCSGRLTRLFALVRNAKLAYTAHQCVKPSTRIQFAFRHGALDPWSGSSLCCGPSWSSIVDWTTREDQQWRTGLHNPLSYSIPRL